MFTAIWWTGIYFKDVNNSCQEVICRRTEIPITIWVLFRFYFELFRFRFEDCFFTKYKTCIKVFSSASYLLQGFNSEELISLLDISSWLFLAITSLWTASFVKTYDRNGNNSALFSIERRNVAHLLDRTQLHVTFLLIPSPRPSLALAFRVSLKYWSHATSTRLLSWKILTMVLVTNQ